MMIIYSFISVNTMKNGACIIPGFAEVAKSVLSMGKILPFSILKSSFKAENKGITLNIVI
jgi:hypothetical protein